MLDKPSITMEIKCVSRNGRSRNIGFYRIKYDLATSGIKIIVSNDLFQYFSLNFFPYFSSQSIRIYERKAAFNFH